VDAVKAGFDAVVFDLSALPIEQNVRQTREAVGALKCSPITAPLGRKYRSTTSSLPLVSDARSKLFVSCLDLGHYLGEDDNRIRFTHLLQRAQISSKNRL
jgi:hypothetical protein